MREDCLSLAMAGPRGLGCKGSLRAPGRSCERRRLLRGLGLGLGLWGGIGAAQAEVRSRGEALLLHHGSGAELELQLHARLAATPAAGESGATSGAKSPGGKPSEIPATVPAIRFYPFTSWRTEGEEQVSEVAAPTGLRFLVRVREEADGHFSVRMDASATAPAWVGLLSLEAEVSAAGAQVAGRDLRPHRVERVAALSGLDPKWVILQTGAAAAPGRHAAADDAAPSDNTPWTVVVDDQADGLKVHSERSRLRLQADLLSSEARPFSYFINCTDNWRAPNHRVELPVRQLQEGEALAVTMSLYAGGAVPLFKARYPDGRSAALVITDHADQTAAPTLRALAGGTSNTAAATWGKGGLLGSGLLITKALWLSSGEPAPAPLLSPSAVAHAAPSAARPVPILPGRSRLKSKSLQSFRQRYERPQVDPTGGGRPQLDDPEVAELAERLAKAGWELVPHSATPLRDERERTEEALQFFDRWKARTWIDHQPYTNCEALINRGYQLGEFGIVDLLAQHSYGYAWSGLDIPPSPSLNLLNPRHLDRYQPVLWPSGRLWPGTPASLWLFSSMTTYMDSAKFFSIYKKKSLDQLERERGLHIAHTYLESFHPPGSMFAKRNLMVPGRHPGEIVPHPKLAELFQQLAARVRRGTLWVPTLQQLGDHMRAMAGVVVRLGSDGSAVLRAEHSLTGATFVVPVPGLRILVDGQPAKGVSHNKLETSFWVDLPENKSVRVELIDPSGKPLSILRPPARKSLLAGLPSPSRAEPGVRRPLPGSLAGTLPVALPGTNPPPGTVSSPGTAD